MQTRSRNHKGYSPNDSLFTPPEIFEALDTTFDVDVCAPSGGLAWIPANEFIDESKDGLASEWRGVVWMNPPYSNPTPWVEKWINHGNGYALVPFTRANWFIKLWDSGAVVQCLHSSIQFITAEGKRQGIFMPVSLWAIGDEPIRVLQNSPIGKVR